MTDTTIESSDRDLIAAAACGDLNAVQTLLQNGADVNAADADGCTVLMWAAFACSSDVVRLLLDHGADVNLTDRNGETALMGVIHQQHVEDDPDDIVDFCQVIDLLRAAEIGICI